MSSEDPESPRSDASFDSESEIEDTGMIRPPPNFVKLADILTIGALYKTSELKVADKAKVKYGPNSSYLERVSLHQGDITRLDIDAIVNAANRSLLGGGGVDGAIHAAAGRKLLDECRGLNGCLTGESKITRGYNLPARHVIHTVGPIYSVREKDEKATQLKSAYKSSLELAVEYAIRHIAFPSISTGIYSYPIIDATRIALNTTREFLDSEQGNKLERIIFVVWSSEDKAVYEKLIPEYFPLSEEPESALTDVKKSPSDAQSSSASD